MPDQPIQSAASTGLIVLWGVVLNVLNDSARQAFAVAPVIFCRCVRVLQKQAELTCQLVAVEPGFRHVGANAVERAACPLVPHTVCRHATQTYPLTNLSQLGKESL